jgi:hypothetical protein
MSDYRLDRLNTREFEHLTQALCKIFIAPGVTPFGDGPDGGREATFEGAMDFPSTSSPWDGYLVVQCKFRQRSADDNENDAGWALAELRNELSKYDPVVGTKNAPKRSRRVPKYFLYVTNAILTPALETGGKDKCISLLASEAGRLGLTGYDVWGFDDLCRYLDLSPNLRQAYSGFILPDDVLYRAVQALNMIEPDFDNTLFRFLQKELKSDSAAKLQSAGQYDNKSEIPLSSVFHDIPFDLSKDAALEPNDEHNEVINYLVEKGDQVIKYSRGLEINSSTGISTKNGRYILVGGPGQGKSTVGQFLCQLYRSALIRDSAKSMEEGIKPIVVGIENSCNVNGIKLPACRRFPFRIVLNLFATDLANEPELTIPEYIRRRLKKHGNVENLSLDVLNKWLAGYPWLFVLDGLDEVPSSSNRAEVLSSIQNFLIDLTSSKSDVLVIATTRPQGYSDDLAEDFFQHMYLAPLSEIKALAYGSSLLRQRSNGDDEKFEQAFRRMEMAAQNTATIRLMRSPLQVTIMATLVERLGEPPKQRYRLFAEYYRTIYDREASREGALSRLLNDRKTDIDVIHYRTGVLLQAASEKAGKTDASITLENLLGLVRLRLIDEMGEKPQKIEPLISEVRVAALERLVFLVSPANEQVGFEIRSLQEFMAAEAMYRSNNTELLIARVTEIAPISHWRNVLLFLIGKCFFEDNNQVLDRVLLLCDELNDDPTAPEYSAVRWGSQLALDILLDGVAQNNPKHERKLVQTALKLLDTQKRDFVGELASIYHPDLAEAFSDKILACIRSSRTADCVGAWQLLQNLVIKGEVWAVEIFEENWSFLNPRQRLKVIDELKLNTSPFLLKKIISDIPHWSPWEAFSVLEGRNFHSNIYEFSEDQKNEGPEWFRAVFEMSIHGTWQFFPRDKNMSNRRQAKCEIDDESVNLNFTSILYDKDNLVGLAIKDIPYVNQDWVPYIATSKFIASPSKETLGEALELLSLCESETNVKWIAPWPLSSLLNLTNSNDDLKNFSKLALEGRFGDYADWVSVENKLESDPKFLQKALAEQIAESDIANGLATDMPIVSLGLTPRLDWKKIDYFLKTFKKTSAGVSRAWLANSMFEQWRYPRAAYDDVKSFKISVEDFCDLLFELKENHSCTSRSLSEIEFSGDQVESFEALFNFLLNERKCFSNYVALSGKSSLLDAGYKLLLEAYGPIERVIQWGTLLADIGGLPAIPLNLRANAPSCKKLSDLQRTLVGLGSHEMTWEETCILVENFVDGITADESLIFKRWMQICSAITLLNIDDKNRFCVHMLSTLKNNIPLDKEIVIDAIYRELEHSLKMKKTSFSTSSESWNNLGLPHMS